MAIRLRLRAFALAGILVTVLFAFVVTGSACSNDGAAISGSPGGQAVVQIPAPGAGAAYTPPLLPERGPSMPPDTIPLETLYRQGAADVLRGLVNATGGSK